MGDLCFVAFFLFLGDYTHTHTRQYILEFRNNSKSHSQAEIVQDNLHEEVATSKHLK